MNDTAVATRPQTPTGPPRLGFLGIGGIGRDRMRALAAGGAVEVAAIAGPAAAETRAVIDAARRARLLLGADLPGAA